MKNTFGKFYKVKFCNCVLFMRSYQIIHQYMVMEKEKQTERIAWYIVTIFQLVISAPVEPRVEQADQIIFI